VLRRCFPARIEGWKPAIERMIPTYGFRLSDDPGTAEQIQQTTAKALGLTA
jgi:malate dehydrogenase (quinone)